MSVNFGYWLGQKYKAIQEQAAAGTTNAAANTMNAQSSALNAKSNASASAAAAAVDNAKAKLMPVESRANVAQTYAQTGLLGAQTGYTNKQTEWFGDQAASEIAQRGAQTDYTRSQDKALQRQSIDLFGANTPGSALGKVLGGRSGLGDLGLPTLARTPRPGDLDIYGNPTAAGQNYLNYMD